MARLQLPEPVKLLVASLWAREEELREALASLSRLWGEIDHEGKDHPFDSTRYYEAEMGPDLKRRIVSFAPLVAPDFLVEAKLQAIEVENLRGRSGIAGQSGGRRVNLDVGYLDSHKVVLASVKPGALKLHLGKGVYADMVFRYSKGRFQPFEWSFADFRDGRYEADFLRIRELYKEQLRG